MPKTLSGISLVIRAFVPTGLTMQEQISTLTAIDLAVKTRKFSGVIDKAIIEDVKYTAGRKRFEDTGGVIAGDQTQIDVEEAIAAQQPTVADLTPPAEEEVTNDQPTDADMVPQEDDQDDGDVPQWMQEAAAAEADLPKPVEAPRTDVPVAGKPPANPINPALIAAAEAARAKSASIGNTAPATQPAVKPVPRQPNPADVAATAAATSKPAETPTVTSGPRRRTAPAK